MNRLARRTTLGAGAPPPTYTPPVAGPLAWFDAGTESYANGAAVTSATDRSGNSRDATAAGTTRPSFVTAAVNGLPVYRFDGVNDMLQTAAFVLSQPLNVFIVGKATGTGAGQYFCDGRGGNTMVMQKNSGGNLGLYAGAFLTNGALDTAVHVLQATINGGSSAVRLGGGAGTTGDAGSSATSGLTLGAYGGALAFLSGDIAEALFYGSLTLGQVNTVGSYLGTKFGLTWTTAT